LGFNASPDPAGDLCPAIRQARGEVSDRGGFLTVIASVCGTDGDPQGFEKQGQLLRDSGVTVARSSAEAARLCLRLASELDFK